MRNNNNFLSGFGASNNEMSEHDRRLSIHQNRRRLTRGIRMNIGDENSLGNNLQPSSLPSYTESIQSSPAESPPSYTESIQSSPAESPPSYTESIQAMPPFYSASNQVIDSVAHQPQRADQPRSRFYHSSMAGNERSLAARGHRVSSNVHADTLPHSSSNSDNNTGTPVMRQMNSSLSRAKSRINKSVNRVRARINQALNRSDNAVRRLEGSSVEFTDVERSRSDSRSSGSSQYRS